ncbi:hypothetical protein CHS0354_017233 [Potamilus streckersoni]|uniref:Uncharacterized protein n=1 Tax=Potamilus streckersoni TaxID=2493646 RepID=A0AAE0SJ57_9BIVA|nr:hypothetical protein CHS0354_017233 [Potamilus streckersoni]
MPKRKHLSHQNHHLNALNHQTKGRNLDLSGPEKTKMKFITCLLLQLPSSPMKKIMLNCTNQILIQSELVWTQWPTYMRDQAFKTIATREAGEKAAEKMQAPSTQQLTDCIFESCEDLKKIKDTIISSFKVTGVSNPLNGREDHCVRNNNEATLESLSSDEEFEWFEGVELEDI